MGDSSLALSYLSRQVPGRADLATSSHTLGGPLIQLFRLLPHHIYPIIHTRAAHLRTQTTMFTRRGAVARPDESATHNVNERRLPTPVNHFNTLRPPPPGPPDTRSFPSTMFYSEVSSESISLASQGHPRSAQPPVSGHSIPWHRSMGVPYTQGKGSSGSASVSVPHHNLNSGPLASWATVLPYGQAPGKSVAQPAPSNHLQYGQPWNAGPSAPLTVPMQVSHSQTSSGGVCQPFDYFHHTLPQPNMIPKAPRAIKRTRQRHFSSKTVPESRPVRTSSITSGYASSVHDGSPEKHPPWLVDRVTSDQMANDRATSRTRSSSPEVNLNIILEDPKSGRLYREKRVRSQDELDNQKKGMRILKDNGGACSACYKSKKRCGPGEPCPHCAARNRKCVRVNRDDGMIQSTGDPPMPAAAGPVLLLSSQPYVPASPQSISPPTQPASAPSRPLVPPVGFETLTLVQSSSTTRRCPAEENPVEPVLDEDPPSLDPDPNDDFFDPFADLSWEAGMLCIDSSYDNLSCNRVEPDTGGHLTT